MKNTFKKSGFMLNPLKIFYFLTSAKPEEEKKAEMETIEEGKESSEKEDEGGDNKHRDSGSDFEIIEPSCKKTD